MRRRHISTSHFVCVVLKHSNIRAVGVSAATGEGVEPLFEAFAAAAVEFREEYLPELIRYYHLQPRGWLMDLTSPWWTLP